MKRHERIELLTRLGAFISSGDEEWQNAKIKAGQVNNWFIEPFIRQAGEVITSEYLNASILENFANRYNVGDDDNHNKTVGIVMAGNIPLVGFHDFLCCFLSGYKCLIKPSSKDEELIKLLVKKMISWDERAADFISFSSLLRNCDAYIATGSNNSGRYFDYYFKNYEHIIRRNRTSVAILNGKESSTDLLLLADDVHLYFGLGCRNVTKIYVPGGYDFVPLLQAFKKYNYFIDQHKYKNNYDYNLAVCLLNKQYYMTNESILILENASLFSPISVLNYEYYNELKPVYEFVNESKDVQAIIGLGGIPFGEAQYPSISDFADGVDTMQFLNKPVLKPA